MITRTVANDITSLLGSDKAIIIMGARQVGKSVSGQGVTDLSSFL